MTYTQPPRLKHGDEFGALIRAAEPVVTADRVAANGARVKASIAAGASTFALWKLLVPFLLLIAVIAPIVVMQLGSDPEPVAPAPVVAIVPVDAALVIVDAEVVAIVEDAAVVAIDAPPRRLAVARVVPDAGVIADAAEPASDLPEQIRLYEAARLARQRGELARGIDLVDELLRRFPNTQLRAEAELTRAELLVRANRADAVTALEALAGNPVHRGRRGELLRTLGDFQRRRGDCTAAIDAYTRALAERVSQRDRADIERNRDRCRAP